MNGCPDTGSPARVDDALIRETWLAVGGDPSARDRLTVTGTGNLPSVFAVTPLAAASIGVAGLAISTLVGRLTGRSPDVWVDRRLASFWFGSSIRPQSWALPPSWDAVAGDYTTTDGWIKLHTNVPAHRRAALDVLGVAADRDAVAQAVAVWPGEALETAISAAGGCAAAMRSATTWASHAQGRAVAEEPLALRQNGAPAPPFQPLGTDDRPLSGVRVLDLTRVLAGPVATRFLAAYGADVLRIDPPDWDEPGLVPEIMAGKRAARLDLRRPDTLNRLTRLLDRADILVHGYRPGALDRLGLDMETRRQRWPGLVDVGLNAYGWSGPWRGRRGFDSLVQMSTGLADAGMRRLKRDRPTPLPVQALDHATGYRMAAAAVLGLLHRLNTGSGVTVQTSLARTAAQLLAHPADPDAAPPAAETPADVDDTVEATSWGSARRLYPPLVIPGTPFRWDRPASALGSDTPEW